MEFVCKLIEWKFMPEGKRLRSSNYLECEIDNTGYMFSESTQKREALFISRVTEHTSDIVNFYCYDCVERLKDFLNSGEINMICKCSIGGWDFLYQFELLDNGDLLIGVSYIEESKIINIHKSLVPSLKNFLNQHIWIMGNKEIIRGGLDIIREKIENCDLDILDYIKVVTSQMEVGLIEHSITLNDYKQMDNEISMLIDKFKSDCRPKINLKDIARH